MRKFLFVTMGILFFHPVFALAQQTAPAQYEAIPSEEENTDPPATSVSDEPSESEEDTQGPMLAPIPTPPPALAALPAEEGLEAGYRKIAVLQGLNKVTARISAFDAPVGETVQFGNLEIAVKRCWQAPPTERPGNIALIEIWDRKPGETPKSVFHGWMFSASPSLAGLEHPVYDIIVLACQHEPSKTKD